MKEALAELIGELNRIDVLGFEIMLWAGFKSMNYFDAVGTFFAFLDAKPCWQ